MVVDYSQTQRFQSAQAENGRFRERALAPGGGGSDSGVMDDLATRVKALGTKVDGLDLRLVRVEVGLQAVADRMGGLDKRMDRVAVQLDGIDTRLRAVEQSLAEISGKLTTLTALTAQMVGKLPSWWQMPAVIGSTIVVIGALWAGGRYLIKIGIF